MLDHALQFKGEAKKVNNKTFKCNLYLIAQKSSCFDNFIVLNILPQWRSDVSLIKNGSSNLSPKLFNGYVDQNKKILQYLNFRCGRIHLNISLKKICKSY